MKTYHNHRAEPYFTYLKLGEKTVEGRVKKGWYRYVQPGDQIEVYNEEETDSVLVRVKRVAEYSSIKAMLEGEELNKLLPDVNNITEGINVYRQFYTPEQESEFGMVAIEVEVINLRDVSQDQ